MDNRYTKTPQISKERLKELRLKLENTRKSAENDKDCSCKWYQPSTFAAEEIKEHHFSDDFVDSQKYLSQNYLELSNKYGNKTWLIIGKNGVIDFSDDFDSIHNTFHNNNNNNRGSDIFRIFLFLE
jgi:hypothetical protein